jgi:hypothetical protein
VLAPDGRSGYLAWQQGQSVVVASITIGDEPTTISRVD